MVKFHKNIIKKNFGNLTTNSPITTKRFITTEMESTATETNVDYSPTIPTENSTSTNILFLSSSFNIDDNTTAVYTNNPTTNNFTNNITTIENHTNLVDLYNTLLELLNYLKELLGL